MSTLDVLIRTALVAALSAGALMLVSSLKPASTDERTLVEIEIQPTELHRDPDTKQRLRAGYQLVSGGIVVGALSALAISVLLAYLVGVVTGLLG